MSQLSIVEMTDRTRNESLMSLVANLSAQMSKVEDQDKLSSFVVAESIVDILISKTMHIKYMQEVEAKVKPYVICDTTL